ncbi:MAG: enoyl-CoA hydratase [Acidimicrobiales bacterium mtb01]|nr:enoyl-CoA hydratase/isomerase family protein [Actinomycetota bacterium]TEX44941.1 MAG: enoyl-CoA hydratase [Acidimicrobiales bacterium mtb01]
MNFQNLRLDVDGRIAHLTLARSRRLNALSKDLLREVVAACEEVNRSDDVRVMVVSGEGTSFSAGFDLSDFASGDTNPRESADLGRLATEALTDVRALTIAAISGHCVGGGLVLAGACDLRVAASDVRFSIPEVDLGIPLAWGGIPRLVREIGPALTKELVLTCRPFGADEAKSIGFLNEVVAPDRVMSRAGELARSLADKPRYALTVTKQQVNAVMEEIAGTGRNTTDAEVLVFAMRDPESREASRRFLEARSRPR